MQSAFKHWANLEAACDDSSMNLNRSGKENQESYCKIYERLYLPVCHASLFEEAMTRMMDEGHTFNVKFLDIRVSSN